MAGLYEIWRDPTRDDDDPGPVPLDLHRAHHRGRGRLGHIHDRMPLMVERDRWGAWLDPTASGRDDLLDLLVPAAPGRLEAYPVSTAGQQRPQQRPGAARAAPARRGAA